jgi:DNA repair exonuclease SbcCD ATPase subunit
VDITAFSEKKTKSVGDFTDILKSEIQVEVKDGVKNIDPRLYSDGEIGKLSNAFVRSLRELALKSGKGCNILMLDEILDSLDPENSTTAVELVRKLSDNQCVVLISHTLRNFIEADESLVLS